MGKVVSHPSVVLLVAELLGGLIYPFMKEGGVGGVEGGILAGRATGMAIWSGAGLMGTDVDRGDPGGRCASASSIIDEIDPMNGWKRPPRRWMKNTSTPPRA